MLHNEFFDVCRCLLGSFLFQYFIHERSQLVYVGVAAPLVCVIVVTPRYHIVHLKLSFCCSTSQLLRHLGWAQLIDFTGDEKNGGFDLGDFSLTVPL